MSNVSIYAKSWIDLVFEGKNKTYGAYQLRQENSKTSLLAFLGGVVFFSALIGLGLFLTSFGEKTQATVEEGPVIIISDVYNPPKDNNDPGPKKEIIPPIEKDEPQQKVETKDLVNPIIVKHTDNPDDITANKDLGKSNDDPNANAGNNTGATTTNPGGGSDSGTSTKGSGGDGEKDSGVKNTSELDILPQYPGGMNRFYEYVVKNFDRPEIDDSREITMSVIVSFVIEKDGTLTDIKAIRSTDYNMEKEAIRILKASRVKWTPGKKDGKPVRTLFMLPIKVKI